MVHTARLQFFLHPDVLSAVHGALLPESGASEDDDEAGASSGATPKTRTMPTLAGGALVLDIQADDLASLRAAINSHLRWVDAAEKAASLAR